MAVSTKQIVFLSLFLAACGDQGPHDNRGPEDRGTLVLDHVDEQYVGGPIWTKDGSEVVFAAGGLKAVNVSTHAVRVLDPGPFIEIAARGDEWIYFTVALPNAPANGPSFRLSRVRPSQTGVENIALPAQNLGSTVVVSRDERWIALGGLLIDMQNGTTRPLPGNGEPLGFSRDGTRLLSRVLGTTGFSYVLIATADGSSQPVPSGTPSFLMGFRWVEGSPQFLDLRGPPGQSNYQLSEIDGISGTTRPLWESTDLISVFFAKWSDDGQTLAVWVAKGLGPTRNELTLLRTGAQPTVVAKVDASVGTPAISPAGSSIFYPVYTATGLFTGYTTYYVKSGI